MPLKQITALDLLHATVRAAPSALAYDLLSGYLDALETCLPFKMGSTPEYETGWALCNREPTTLGAREQEVLSVIKAIQNLGR